MDKHEFEQFVTEHGKEILRFCRMNAGSTERGNELYQDTMVKLLQKQKKLDAAPRIRSSSASRFSAVPAPVYVLFYPAEEMLRRQIFSSKVPTVSVPSHTRMRPGR